MQLANHSTVHRAQFTALYTVCADGIRGGCQIISTLCDFTSGTLPQSYSILIRLKILFFLKGGAGNSMQNKIIVERKRDRE